jgi:predicted DNA-binding transcriptional regulator AlpA
VATGARLARVVEALDGRLIEVLTASEVAGVLGVTRQRVYQLADRQGFPSPLGQDDVDSRATLWSRLEVEEWNLKTRTAGRPPSEPVGPTGFAIDMKVTFDARFGPSDAGRAALKEAMSRLASRGLVKPEVAWIGDAAQVRLGVAAFDRDEAVATASKIVKLRASLEARIAPEWAITTTIFDVEVLGDYIG